jgi:acyl-CoA thioester hydrolase
MSTLRDLRVYYEDTDFSGRVYHASYLRLLERGRTEWLRMFGFEHRALSGTGGLIFVVRRLQVEYIQPALLDDLLQIDTDISNVQGAVIEFKQSIVRRREEIARATVGVVTVKKDRAVRVPREILMRIEPSKVP